jgi:hypothetical protein
MSEPWTPGPWSVFADGSIECPGIEAYGSEVSILVFAECFTDR